MEQLLYDQSMNQMRRQIFIPNHTVSLIVYSDDDKKWNYGKEITFKVPEGYDDRLDHFTNFFESVRTGKAVAEDATFGLRAAAPALACNMSAASGKPILWDAEKMKLL